MAAKEKICHALLELLKEKDVNDITVSELIRLAGVSRSSYYYYFYRPKSILDDLLQDFLNTYAELLNTLGPDTASDGQNAALALARHFYEHQTLAARLFFSNYHDKFLSDLIRVYLSALESYDVYAETGGQLEKVEDPSLLGLYSYDAGYAFAGRMEWWAGSGFALTPEELLAYTGRMERMVRVRFLRRSAKP